MASGDGVGDLGDGPAPGWDVRDTRLLGRAVRERWPMQPSVRIQVINFLLAVIYGELPETEEETLLRQFADAGDDEFDDLLKDVQRALAKVKAKPKVRERLAAVRALATLDAINLAGTRLEHLIGGGGADSVDEDAVLEAERIRERRRASSAGG